MSCFLTKYLDNIFPRPIIYINSDSDFQTQKATQSKNPDPIAFQSRSLRESNPQLILRRDLLYPFN